MTSETTENNCVWLTAALLVRQFDEDDGNYMIDLFHKDKFSFEWMEIMPPKKKTWDKIGYKRGTDTLLLKLQKDIGYNILKTPNHDPKHKCYKGQLLDTNSTGKYIVRLSIVGGLDIHVVGIDCDNRLIWDCAEEYALELTYDNLNLCAGKDGEVLQYIIHCYQIENQNVKRKSKNIQPKINIDMKKKKNH